MKKNLFKKGLKLTGIAVGLSCVILSAVYAFETRVSAGSSKYKVVAQDYVVSSEEPTAPAADSHAVNDDNTVISNTITDNIITQDESITHEKTTQDNNIQSSIEATTQAPTQPVTQTPAQPVTQTPTKPVTQAPTQPVTQTPTQPVSQAPAQPVTQAPTQAPTQPATQAPTQPAVTYTRVTYKDGNGNSSTFDTLDQAKASLNIPALTDAQAHNQAVTNKSVYAVSAADVLNQLNAYRAANGLPALTYNDNLATAAMHRAAESAYSNWNMTAYENGTTKRHIRPNYQKASTIATYYGIGGNFGENYGRFQSSPSQVMSEWKASSAHNSLMLSGKYTKAGVGVARAANGDYYWIVLFN